MADIAFGSVEFFKVVAEIEAVETARQKREGVIDIQERIESVDDALLELVKTDMTKEPIDEESTGESPQEPPSRAGARQGQREAKHVPSVHFQGYVQAATSGAQTESSDIGHHCSHDQKDLSPCGHRYN